MHPLFIKADKLSHEVIGAAIEVHRHKGPGLIESIYEKCMVRELVLRQISCVNQRAVLIDYKGFTFEEKAHQWNFPSDSCGRKFMNSSFASFPSVGKFRSSSSH